MKDIEALIERLSDDAKYNTYLTRQEAVQALTAQRDEISRLKSELIRVGDHFDAEDKRVAAEFAELQAHNALLAAVLEDVHCWLVCAPIATNDDMAGSFPIMTSATGDALNATPERTKAAAEVLAASVEFDDTGGIEPSRRWVKSVRRYRGAS